MSSVTKSRIAHRVKMVLQSCLKLTHHETASFLEEVCDFHALSQPLTDLGLNRLHLMDEEPFVSPDPLPVLSNHVIVALEQFQVREKLPLSFVQNWIRKLNPVCSLTDSQLRTRILSLCKRVRDFVNKKKTEQLNADLCQPFPIHIKLLDPLSTSQTQAKSPLKTAPCNDCKVLKKCNEILKSKLFTSSLEAQILKADRNDLREKLSNCEISCFRAEEMLNVKIKDNNLLIAQLKHKEEELIAFNRSKTYRLNVSLKKDLAETAATINSLNCEIETLKDEMLKIKHKLRIAQTSKASLNKKLVAEKKKNQSVSNFLQMDDDDDDDLRLEHSNKFKQSVRLAYMELQGKAMVAATKCSQVVQIVGKHFFGREFTLQELPSTTSILKFADEAQHISMYQVVDKIKNCSHFTYASDGTSRQKKNYLERHIVLEDKTVLSVGYTEIATDDAKTLMETTLEMLDELASIYSTDEELKQSVFKEMIKKMKCLISDRAAVNKLFNKKMSEYRKAYLGDEDTTTHFLYCNAHFLLGMSRATENTVKDIEKSIIEEHGSLGRDKQKTFNRFSTSSESAACRVIRLTAECLGPRCDEKNGSREEWLGYCDSHNITSKFCSFRSNRFNNLFENAVATLYHHRHIDDFITNFCSHASNLKLQSIVADLADENIMSIVGAIALFNVIITQPYWKLMNSSVPYGSFPEYAAKKLEIALLEFTTERIDNECDATPVYEEYAALDDSTWTSLFSLCVKDIWTTTFMKIAESCLIVLKRQLNDFLDGGIFGGAIDPETQKVLDTCTLTNLSGEQFFGDLDYDMLKRRHATTHHRSSVTMWKHNNTSSWLQEQKQEERSRIIDAAVKNSSSLRKRHRDNVLIVKERVKERLTETKLGNDKKAIKSSETKASLLDQVIAQGGVCRSKEQLDELYHNSNAEALKVQIRYRKLFLGEKHLRLSGPSKTLYPTLLNAIEGNYVSSSKRLKTEDSSSESD